MGSKGNILPQLFTAFPNLMTQNFALKVLSVSLLDNPI